MRQRLIIIGVVALVIALLVGLNAASYVEIERAPESEYNPDRSTYNARATGTRALYDFLRETGHQVVRWREDATTLGKSGRLQPATFISMQEKFPFQPNEVKTLMEWVKSGGRLVIIDRRPDARLLPQSGNWRINTELKQFPTPDAHSDNPEEMTAGVSLARPAQPTALTRDVESVMPSRFAGLINIWPVEAEHRPETAKGAAEQRPAEDEESPTRDDESARTEPTPKREGAARTDVPREGRSLAPVVHVADYRGAILADYPHGAGRIVILSDPFIVANNGISRADNLQLAVNVIAGAGGPIAFDEYHQGYGVTRNEMLAYFEGTPVLAALGQLTLIALLILWTRGRRFARPLPLARVDRRSSLEFVASMAELQQRARAYDLAIENIYTRTRRVLARYGGCDPKSTRQEIAARVAARSALDRQHLETLMRDCEEAMQGEPISARRSLALVAELRELERALGLRMRAREIKQAKERQADFGF